DAASVARLEAHSLRRVFITENETNFLAFPPVEKAIVVFGAGYGWEALGKARWLERCALHYWGDIDTHGFVILDRLREHFPRVESFLMDRATLFAHEESWGEENDPAAHDLSRLTEAERALYDELRDNRIRKGLRLEQERIGFGWMNDAVERLVRESS
ncbi:MAG: Wadjet anti-phage system protein JetD domain-containing protein, partial [Burkholderiales bacterium]